MDKNLPFQYTHRHILHYSQIYRPVELFIFMILQDIVAFTRKVSVGNHDNCEDRIEIGASRGGAREVYFGVQSVIKYS